MELRQGPLGLPVHPAADRLTTPLVRDEHTGELREASWSEALTVAAEGLRAAREGQQGTACSPAAG